VGLVHRGQLPQRPAGGRVGEGIGGVGVVHVRADQVRLEHAVDGDEPLDGRLQVPDALAQAGEVVGRGLLPVAARPQLVQPLAEHRRRLSVVVDLVAERGLEGEVGRRVRPAPDHLHQLDLEVAVVGEPL